MGFVQQVLDTGYQKLNSTGALSSNELHWFMTCVYPIAFQRKHTEGLFS